MYNIKAFFAVNEKGDVFPLVISNAQENEGRYSHTIKIGNKTQVNEYEEDEVEFWLDAQDDSDVFPSDESMALYLKNVPSQGLGELFETSNFDDTAIGFIIIEFRKGLLYSSSQDEYVRETVIFKEKNPFIYRSIDLAEEFIPEVKEFYSCKNHFDDDRSYDIQSLRAVDIIDNKNYYTFVESVSDISNKSYGSKNGSIFEQTNNLFKPIEPSYDLIEYFDYDECVELMEKWNDTFNDLDFYRYRANTLCCFSNDELSEMITTLERRRRGISEYYKKETEKVNKQLTFIKGFCSENK